MRILTLASAICEVQPVTAKVGTGSASPRTTRTVTPFRACPIRSAFAAGKLNPL